MNNSLKIVQGSKMFSTADNGREPNEWKVVHYANVGGFEEFVEQFSGEFLELIDASSIFEPERQELKEAIVPILIEGLIPAFEHLRKIPRLRQARNSGSKSNAAVGGLQPRTVARIQRPYAQSECPFRH